MDTLRVVIDWRCNMKCSYCCNEQPQIRKQFQSVNYSELIGMMHKFKTLCITGGEPLLEPLKIYKVLRAAKYGSKEMPLVVLYTNGALMTSTVAKIFEFWGINAMNVGLHVPSTFDAIIKRCTLATKDTNLTIRFHAQDVYAEQLTTAHPTVNFKFWKLNDCDRENEMRVVLVD